MKKKKILAIDDNAAILNVMRIILKDNGYEIMTRLNTETLTKDIKKFMPDLIFLDVWLRGENGIEIAKRLKADKNTAAISVVLISAAADVKKKLRESQADDFLAKPFEMTTLIETAKNYT
jgi:DNA-binding response OmpR family regulator